MTSPMPELLEQIVGGPSIHEYQLDGTKVGWYADRIAAWGRGEKIAPITIDAAWTRRCQAACNFCYAQLQSSSDGGVITKKHAFEFLEDAAEIGVRGVSLISDGESTMVPYYAESIKYGASLGLSIGIGTNGIALKREVLEEVLPSLTYLRFNFSGGERKRYAEIMGVKQTFYDRVIQNIKDAVAIKRRDGLNTTINMNLVSMPKDGDQIVPFAKLAKELGVDYGIIKHCADDNEGHLGVDYKEYSDLYPAFREAEALTDENSRIVVKWSRIEDEGKRKYTKCLGAPFIMQLSGNGLIAPCGMLFNEKFKAFHIGSILTDRFRKIWESDRYTEVMNYLASDYFNPQVRCGINCLQHLTNDWLFKYTQGEVALPVGEPPPHLGFL